MPIIDQLNDLARRIQLQVSPIVAPDAAREVLQCEWTARLVGGPLPGGDGANPDDPPVVDLSDKLSGLLGGGDSAKKGKDTKGSDAKGSDAKGSKDGKGSKGGLPVDVSGALPSGDDGDGDGGDGGGGDGGPIPDTDVLDIATVSGEVRWTLRDESGGEAREVKWKLGSDAHWRNGAPSEALSPLDEQLAFQLLGVLLYDKDADTAPEKTVSLQASVELTAGTESTGWIDLPPRQVALPALGIPTMAVLFEHENFGAGRQGQRRRALIVLPTNAFQHGESGARAAIQALNSALRTTAVANGALRLLAIAAGEADAYAFVDRTKVEPRDEIGHMGIEIDHWDAVNWFHAEDNISSLILIGAPGRQLQFFNARNFDPSEGHMNVTVGPEGAVLIRDLASADPVSEPPGRVEVVHAPAKERHKNADPSHDITTFGDEVSSIRFDWGPVPGVHVSEARVLAKRG